MTTEDTWPPEAAETIREGLARPVQGYAANSTARKREAELLATVPFKAADLIRCRVRLPFGPEKPCACNDGDCAQGRPFTFTAYQPAEPDAGDVEALAKVLAEHDNEPGWTCGDDDMPVYECQCGDRSPAITHDFIFPEDCEAAAQWHREHIATVILLARQEQGS